MLLQFVKFNLVGIVNTIVGFTIIMVLMLIGLSATVSNIVGYAIGAILSYYLHSQYTFKNALYSVYTIRKFLGVLAIAYLFNFVTLQMLLEKMDPYGAQLIATIVYSGISFFLMKMFVFKI